MATRGRIKGWKSPAAVAAMSPEEREAYETMMAKAKAEREAEKKQELINKGIDPEAHEKAKAEKQAQRQEKEINLQNLINSQLEYQRTHIMSQEEDEEEQNGKPWYQANDDGNDHKETVINHLAGEGFCIIESNESFWIRKIAEMIEKTPNKVIILDNWCNGDMIRVKIPYSAMKKIKTQNRTISDEQRQRMSELGKSMSGKRRGRPKKNQDESPVEESVENPTKKREEIENGLVRPNADTVYEYSNSDVPDSNDNNTSDRLMPINIEESDKEFESTPMNIHRNYTGEEPNIQEESQTENEDDEDFQFCVMPSMFFGHDVKRIREHTDPRRLNCDTADQDDYEKNWDEDDYDDFE